MNDTLHLVCTHCHTTNRLPRARLESQPKCGHCHQPLFAGHPFDLTAADFRRHLAHDGVPLLVKFWAPWCGYCRKMAPEFEQAAPRLEPRIRLGKVNSDQEPALAGQYSVQGLPTLILFRGGREAVRQSGALTVEQIVAWVRNHL